MRAYTFVSFVLVAVSSVTAHIVFPRSARDGPCTGKDGVMGVCVPTNSCTNEGGVFIHNACPDTPEDIKCCTKPECQLQAKSGDCRWVENCGGGKSIIQNLCPGPDAFRCCVTNEGNTTSSALPSSTGSAAHHIITSGTVNATTSASSSTPTESDVPLKSSSKPSATSKPKPKPTLKPEPNLGEKILKKAKEAEGIPYHWAGGSCKGTTGGGYDCSGLVSWAVCQVTGRDLFSEGLRVTRSMYCASEKTLKYEKVKWENRRAGDAVFFGRKSGGSCDCSNNPAGIHHVGLMMDDGYTMFNALKTGTNIRTDNFKSWSDKPCEYVIRFQ